MSILCCRVPHFLYGLACRHHPALGERPVALLGLDETVCAVSPVAKQRGVQVTMRPRQAQMRCPDLLLQLLDLTCVQAE